MLSVELGVRLKPLLRGAVLVLLKICYEVIKNICEVVLESIIADEPLYPNDEARASLGDESNTDGGVNEPCREEGIQFVKRILEFR